MIRKIFLIVSLGLVISNYLYSQDIITSYVINTAGQLNVSGNYQLLNNTGETVIEIKSGDNYIDRSGFINTLEIGAPPESSISFPTTGNIFGPLMPLTTISGTSSDDSKVSKVEISIKRDSDNNYWNGSMWSNIENWVTATGTDNWVYNSSSVTFTDGTYLIKSRATDIDGNVEVPGIGVSFTYDGTSPVVPTNTLTSPNGGEYWLTDEIHNITWNQNSIIDNFGLRNNPISLHYSTDGTNWTLIAGNLPNTGTYSFTVPLIDSITVRVRITATDLANNTNFDTSDNVFTVGSYTGLANTPGLVGPGGSIAFNGSSIKALQGGGNSAFWHYDVVTKDILMIWEENRAAAPGAVGVGGDLCQTGGGNFALQGNNANGFWLYITPLNQWNLPGNTPPALPGIVSAGGSLVADNSGPPDVYILQGGGNRTFWRYNRTVTDPFPLTFETLRDTPGQINAGSSLTFDGTFIYALQGGGSNAFWRYNTGTNEWETMANTPGFVNAGGSLNYPISSGGNFIYALQGGTNTIWRYELPTIDNPQGRWIEMPPLPANFIIGDGGSLAANTDFVYVLRGGNTNEFLRYTLPAQAGVGVGGVASTEFSNIYVTFKEGRIIRETGESQVIVSTSKTVDLKELAQANVTESLGASFVGAGDYTKIRLILSEVTGVKKDTGEIIKFELENPIYETLYSFKVSQGGFSYITILFDLNNSIKQVNNEYVFVPVAKSINVPEHSFMIALRPSSLILKPGATGNLNLEITNRGNVMDNYKIEVITDINKNWINYPANVSIGSGETKTAEIKWTIPAGVSSNSYVFEVKVTTELPNGVANVISPEYYTHRTIGKLEVIEDNIPPQVVFLSPSKDDVGISKYITGVVKLIGTFKDNVAVDYYLVEYEVGDAPQNWIIIQDKTYKEVIENVLATWDTTNLPAGVYTLRLTGVDKVGNTAEDKVTVNVGSPNSLLSIRDKFNHPDGISLDSVGYIYIADRNNDVVKKIDLSGRFIEIGKKELNKPEGVFIDKSDNIYIADRNGNEVRIYNSSLQLVKVLGTGILNKAVAVVVDDTGNIYVVDRNNDRIVRFNTDESISIIGEGILNKPEGIFLDKGNIYVADRNNDCIREFSNAGNLIETIGKGELNPSASSGLCKPSSVYVCANGDIFVSDTNNDRVVRFDKYRNIVFSLKTWDSPQGTVSGFNKPKGITIDRLGNLYVSNSNNSLIEIFGESLPNVPSLEAIAKNNDDNSPKETHKLKNDNVHANAKVKDKNNEEKKEKTLSEEVKEQRKKGHEDIERRREELGKDIKESRKNNKEEWEKFREEAKQTKKELEEGLRANRKEIEKGFTRLNNNTNSNSIISNNNNGNHTNPVIIIKVEDAVTGEVLWKEGMDPLILHQGVLIGKKPDKKEEDKEKDSSGSDKGKQDKGDNKKPEESKDKDKKPDEPGKGNSGGQGNQGNNGQGQGNGQGGNNQGNNGNGGNNNNNQGNNGNNNNQDKGKGKK